MHRLLGTLLVAALALALAGCGGDDATSTSNGPGSATSTTAAADTSTTAPSTTTTSTTTSTTAPTTPPHTEGAPYDLFVPMPAERSVIGVVGVRHDDVLNVRSGPAVSFDIVTTLEPTRAGITGTGAGWQLPSGAVWWEIEVDGVTGWANQRFLSRLGPVDDITSSVVDQLGEIPTAETMLELGLTVAELFGDVDLGADIVMSVAPSVGDLGEVTYDVTGFGDDSVAGSRLHVFGQPSAGGEGFSLKSVEATTFCQRGLADGRCV